ncbi:apolipoprotein N-acyltransferase [Pseudorhodobacter sp.]|uniref:apolipoprotein N-acyltransferase n=1 Tax=Pseudorhodobacter sp. TaxID=1934400 RepID=UPI0026476A95|nr:apolipoprotein N-acyltransferase [Pseudorhodobacter sp.]MDN5785700.1 apolipoprotein N-acyltransferase [Pseudorhodobacter sp.]
MKLFRAWPGWRLAAAAFGLGAVMALGQAPLGFWWLTLPALSVGFLLIARAASAGQAAWLGLFLGGGYFMLALSWIVEPFLVEPETYGWMIPFVLLLLPFGLGLFWAAAAGSAHRVGGNPARRVLAAAVLFCGVELARSYVLTGFPWALIGHVWVDTPVAQLAAVAGPIGLTFLTTVVAALPVTFRWPGLAGSAVLIALAFGYGAMQPAAPSPAPDAPVIRLVQPNAEQHLKWQPDRAKLYFSRLLELSAAAPAADQPRPDLVVWPETSVPYLLRGDDRLVAAIAASGQGAQLAIGIQRVDGNRGYNTMAIVSPDGRISQSYDKHHLVPFGEYIPFGNLAYNLFGISAFASQQGAGYSAGAGAAVLDLGAPLGHVLPLICYEAVFPQDLRAAPTRATWILQITNDAWFGNLTGPWQHLAQARLRAIEQGLPFLRAANTGVSAVIDARGKIVTQLGLGVSGFLDARLPPSLPPTIYARTGDWSMFLLLLGLCAALVLRRKRPKA